MLNQVVLMGKFVGQFSSPSAERYAIELEIDGTEYIIYMSKALYDSVDVNKNFEAKIVVKGSLFHHDGYLCIKAEKIFMLED